MRAVVIRQPGDVDVLEMREVADPDPGPEELLIRNFATALNRADLLQRRGLYAPPPGASEILGLEFAGEVARTGSRAHEFRRGDRVFGLIGGGGYAEFLCVHRRLAVPIPDTFSFDTAAAVPEVFYTAHENLFTMGKLEAGQTVLIHAAGSGVGTAAIQLARHARARVLATVRTPEKREHCLELGAEKVVDCGEEDFSDVVGRMTEGAGVDLILDLVGAAYWDRNLRSLRSGGRLLVVGLMGGTMVQADLSFLLRRRLEIVGSSLRGRSLEEKIAITERFRESVLPLLERGEVWPLIDRVYPLEDVKDAHRRMEANLNLGKIVLRM